LALARRAAQKKTLPAELKTFKGTGLLPGIDLNDSAAMLEQIEK
jgi:hypothetical protein